MTNNNLRFYKLFFKNPKNRKKYFQVIGEYYNEKDTYKVKLFNQETKIKGETLRQIGLLK